MNLAPERPRLFLGDEGYRREPGLAVVNGDGQAGFDTELGSFAEELPLLARRVWASGLIVPGEWQHALPSLQDHRVDLLIASSRIVVNPLHRICGHINRQLWPRSTEAKIGEFGKPKL